MRWGGFTAQASEPTFMGSVYNHSQGKRLTREINKQTVEAGKDQRKPQLGNTQQAQLMKGKEISNKGLLGREGGDRMQRDSEADCDRFLGNCPFLQQAGPLPSGLSPEVLPVLTQLTPRGLAAPLGTRCLWRHLRSPCHHVTTA